MTYKDLVENQWYASTIVLVTQIAFLYLRTINIIYTSERRVWPTILTNIGVSLTWLLSVGISMGSMFSGSILPILAFLIGSAVGTYLGLLKK